MHERLIVDPTLINKTIPTLRLKADLVGKRLYFWRNGTADDISVLRYTKKDDILRVFVQKTNSSGWTPIPLKIKNEVEKFSKENSLPENEFIYDMKGEKLIYNLTNSEQITWFFSYPPLDVKVNQQYLVYWDEISTDGKTVTQKISRLVQDTDNLAGLATFFNKSTQFVLADESPTDEGLNLSFLLTARTFGLPLRTSNNTFLRQYCERYLRGDNKLDPESFHENFQNIALGVIENKEEEEKSKKELIGGNGKEVGSKSFYLSEILDNGMPFVDDAEIDLNNHSQKGFPVQISNAHIASGYLVLYAEDEMEDYHATLKIFRNIFDFDNILLIALDDTEYEEFRGWLH